MPDMLVKLYDLPEDAQTACPRDESVQIRRAMAPDKFRVVEWVKEHSGLSAAGECDVCFARPAVSCFIATRGKKILGYACYDATAPDFFGPTRVLDEEQGGGIGRAMLLRSLAAMRAEGYAYAVIGGVGSKAGRSSFAVILCANAFSADGSIQPRRWALRYARSCRIPDNAECPRQRRPPSWR